MSISYYILSYIVLIFHISRKTQDKMSQPPHTHRNHPPITPHPKIVFCLIYLYVLLILLRGHQSRCATASLSYRPSQEIPEIPNSPPPPSSNASPPHVPLQTSSSSYTYTYVTDPRSPTSLPHSPEHITVTPHVHELVHLLNKQMPSRK